MPAEMRKKWMLIYLDFSRAFDAVSHNILIDTLMKYRLNMEMVRWRDTG